MSDWLLPLASIAAANLLGAMSPGPAFVLIVRTAIAHGRSAAWRPIAGLALGATVWTAAALWGLQALFAAAPWIAQMLPVAANQIRKAPPAMQAAILAMIAFNEFAWYGIVAAVFGSDAARAVYARAKGGIDRTMAALLFALGAKLAFDALTA